MWERDEILTIIKYEPYKRNKAALSLLWDLNARNHEVTMLKIKHIRLRERYGEGEIPHESKTGTVPINEQLLEDNIPRKVDKYWVCQKGKGAFPQILEQISSDRNKYLTLLREEQEKPDCDLKLIEEYQTHQQGAKLFANAGSGLFGNEYFGFSNYRVYECITAEGRRIHKQMEILAKSFNISVVYGFTDSIFLEGGTHEQMKNFIQICKDKLGMIVELKNTFINSIFYGKKNRYVAWTGNDKDKPIIKGLDGLRDSNPLWLQRWFEKIIIKIVKHPETRLEIIPNMIQEAYDELDSGRINPEGELKFTQRLKKYPHEYKDNVRTGLLAKILNKNKGDLVYWYETFEDKYIEKEKSWKREKNCSVKPEKINIEEYKLLLFNKLKDTLEITGLNIDNLVSFITCNSNLREYIRR